MHHHLHFFRRDVWAASRRRKHQCLASLWCVVAALISGCGQPASKEIIANTPPVPPPATTAVPLDSVPTDPKTLAKIKEAFAKMPVRPLPKDADASHSFRNRQARTDFWRQIFVEGFRAHRGSNATQTDAAEKFLEGYCLRLGESPDAPSTEDLLQQAKSLYETRGADPHLNLALAALFLDSQKEGKGSAAQLAEVVHSLDATNQGGPYSPWLTARIHRVKAKVLSMGDGNGAAVRREQMQLMIDDLLRAGSDPGLTNFQRRMLVYLLKIWEEEFRAGEFRVAWTMKLDSAKNFDPWVREILLTRLYYAVAWRIRGNGPASSMTLDSRMPFFANLEHARRHALRAWELKPELPEAAGEMLKITMTEKGAAGENVRFWFDEAAQADFADLEAYFSLAWALRPRWVGSHEKMLAFGDECLGTGRFDTDVPLMYHKMVSDVVEELGNWPAMLQTPGVYERYVVLFEGLAKNVKNESARHHHLSRLAAISYLAGKTDKAREILSELKDNAHPQVFEPFNLSLESVRNDLGIK